MNIILILVIILSVLLLSCIFCVDHFTPINHLNIKYNSNNIKVPDLLKKPSPKEKSMKDKINAELNSQPLTFENQMYSMSKYPFVGEKQLCFNNDSCSMLTAECNKNNPLIDEIDKRLGKKTDLGICTIRTDDKTVFDIKY